GHPLSLIAGLGLSCRGVIHVGANLGQEFDAYRRAGLESAVYIEPIPEIFTKLQRRVSVEPHHVAVNALCSDRDDEAVEFHIASNQGQSSSILNLGSHASLHPSVRFVSSLAMRTTTLDRIIFESPFIDPRRLDCLVMDVQGAEGLVIAGANRTLANCRFVFAEVSDGGLYKGDASWHDIV